MEFNVLKDLAKTITRNKVKNIEVLGNGNQKKNKSEIFFEGLIADRFKNEKDAVRYFFESYDIKHPTYIKLKNKLVRQLINSAFFIDVNRPNFNDRAKSYFTSYKDFAAVTILIAKGSSSSAVYLLHLILEQAIKYEFIDLAADASKWLRVEYARYNCNIEKNHYYALLHRKYEKKRHYEFLAFDYHEALVSYYIKRRSPNKDIHRMATLYFDELIKLVDEVNTSSFYNHTYKIAMIKYFSINDTENALKVCNEALDVLQLRSNVNRSIIANFKTQKIALYTQLKFKDEIIVNKLFEDCLAILQEGDFSWFRLHEVYLYYCISSDNYVKSLNIYEKANCSFRFDQLNGSFHDNWILIGGYLHLLAKLQVLDSTRVEGIVGAFRFSKLFNEIELLKKDKEGMNIPLVLLPVLYELAEEPFKRTKEIPIEALEKYRQRWLSNETNRRSDCFVKMLISFAKNDYYSPAVVRKINKEFENLKNETPEIAGQYFAIEIIPYETLWELLITKAYPKQTSNNPNGSQASLMTSTSLKKTSKSIRSAS